MKKSTISIILILVILVVSMSFLFVGCKNTSTDPIIGKFERDIIKTHGGYTYEFLADQSVKRNDQVMENCKWQYNSEKKCYEIKNIAHNVVLENFKMIDKNTIEEAFTSSQTPTRYIRVS